MHDYISKTLKVNMYTFLAGGSHLQLCEVMESVPALSLLSTAVTKQDSKAARWLHASPSLKRNMQPEDHVLCLRLSVTYVYIV